MPGDGHRGRKVGAGRADPGVGEHRGSQLVEDRLGLLLAGAKVVATRTDLATTVTVTGHAESIVGFFSLPVRATAAGPTETYTAGGAP